jgi:hypothetical protein
VFAVQVVEILLDRVSRIDETVPELLYVEVKVVVVLLLLVVYLHVPIMLSLKLPAVEAPAPVPVVVPVPESLPPPPHPVSPIKITKHPSIATFLISFLHFCDPLWTPLNTNQDGVFILSFNGHEVDPPSFGRV